MRGTIERALSAGMRVLLGAVGVIAVAGGVIVIVRMSHAFAGGGAGPEVARAFAIVVAALAIVGGVQLVRGAVRGRIAHRRTARQRPAIDPRTP